MPQQLAGGVEVSSCRYQHSGESMAACMEKGWVSKNIYVTFWSIHKGAKENESIGLQSTN